MMKFKKVIILNGRIRIYSIQTHYILTLPKQQQRRRGAVLSKGQLAMDYMLGFYDKQLEY